MNLSNETVTVLKNFSTINQNLVIKAGSKLSTMSAMKNIVASADVQEDFPQDFAIYDLNEFLAALSLFEKIDLDFKNDFVVITEGGDSRRALQYWYSDPSVVTHPKTDITMPDPDVEFEFSSSTLSEVQKAASIIGAPDMVLEGMSKGNSVIKVTDKKNATANDFKVHVPVDENTKDVPYKFWFKVENLKLIPGSYNVNVSSKKISHFSNTKVPVQYYIALEPESSYPNE
tara:strand:+ start:1084 stop:1773 length:690 start_codon:yes stop_codon:yes gene_type:complete